MGKKSGTDEQAAVAEIVEELTAEKKRHRGLKLLFLLALLGVGAAVFSKIRGGQAGPPPVPAAPPAPPRPAPAQEASPVTPVPPVAEEPAVEEPAPVADEVRHAPDVVSDPEVDPLSEGTPVPPDDSKGTFFDQVMAESVAQPSKKKSKS